MKKTKTPAAWLEDRLFDFLDYIEETALLVLEAIYLSFLLVWLRVRPYVLFSFRVAFFPLSFAWDLFKKLPAYLRFITYVCAFVLGLVLVLGPKFFTPYLYGDSSAFGDVYSFLNKHIYQDFYKRRDFHSKGNPYFFSLWVFSLLFVPQLVSAALYRSYWLIDFGGDFTQFRPTRRAPIERATSFTFTHLYIFFYSWAAHASSLAYLNWYPFSCVTRQGWRKDSAMCWGNWRRFNRKYDFLDWEDAAIDSLLDARWARAYEGGFFIVTNKAWHRFRNYTFSPVRYDRYKSPEYEFTVKQFLRHDYRPWRDYKKRYGFAASDRLPFFEPLCRISDASFYTPLARADLYANANSPFNLYGKRNLRPGFPDDYGCWEGYQVGGWTAHVLRGWFLLDRYTAQGVTNTPFVSIIDSHRFFRRLCNARGISLDYTQWFSRGALRSSFHDKESATCFWSVLGGSPLHRSMYHAGKDPFLLTWFISPQMRRHTPVAYRTIVDNPDTPLNARPVWCVSPASSMYDVQESCFLLGPVFPFA